MLRKFYFFAKRNVSAILDRLRQTRSLISDRINPIDDKTLAKSVTILKLLSALSAFGVICGVLLLVTERDPDLFTWIRHCGITLLNGCMTYTNFRDMLEIKKKIRMKKILEIIDVQSDEYETMTLKLAASYPELPPPGKAEYEQVKSRIRHEEETLTVLMGLHKLIAAVSQKPTGAV